jgi:hypothetical protein
MHAAALATCVKGGKETKVDLAPQCHARNYRVLSTYAVDCKSMTGGYRIISVIKSVHARLMQLRHLNQIRSHIATTIQHPDSRLGRWKRLVLDGVGIPRRGKQRRGPHGDTRRSLDSPERDTDLCDRKGGRDGSRGECFYDVPIRCIFFLFLCPCDTHYEHVVYESMVRGCSPLIGMHAVSR